MGAPNTRRRSLLAGLFAAPALATMPAMAAKAVPAESPALLDLGERLTVAAQDLLKAIELRDEATALYERTRPALPEILRAKARDRDLVCQWEMTGGVFVNVYDSKAVRVRLVLTEPSRHSKEGKRLRRIARCAKAFEAADCAALDAAGVDERREEAMAKAAVYFDVAQELPTHTPATFTGALIFARAMPLMELAAKTQCYLAPLPGEREVAERLAEAVVRIGGAP